MKISLEWLGDYIDLPADLAPDTIAHDLTMATVEVEEVIDCAALLGNVVVGKIESIDKHPNADKLSVCSVNVGNETKTIVCGGSNLQLDQRVAVALPGAQVSWHGTDEKTELKPTKIRGVASDGMICAASEIGLETLFPPAHDATTEGRSGSDARILDLTHLDSTVGASLSDVVEFNDHVLVVDNKSLTNRPDLWGHCGIARELAAVYGLDFRGPEKFESEKPESVRVSIEDSNLCRRYTATRIENVQPADSPIKIKSRLARVGQRPINLLVDLTNYVMLAVGQPCHAFDATELNGQISVRLSQPGEQLRLLDGTDLELHKDDLLIADEKGGVALAGVMGGERSSVATETDTLILEVANFEAIAVRKTAKRHDLRTESSNRFEKALDPELVTCGIQLFVELLKEVQPECQVTAYTDMYPAPATTLSIDVALDFLNWRLGKEYSLNEIASCLQKLGFTVEAVKNADSDVRVTIPTWRATGDITLPEDLVEEIARLEGYESFEFVAPKVELSGHVNQQRYQLEKQLREYLSQNAGMYEVMNYPWVHQKYLKAAGCEENLISLESPPSPEEANLQPSLIPQMLKTVVDNLRYQNDFRVFEVNRVFSDSKGGSQQFGAGLPSQPKHLCGACVGKDAKSIFLDAKGIVLGLIDSVIENDLVIIQSDTDVPSWTHADCHFLIQNDGNPVGAVGLLNSQAMKSAGIKNSFVAMFELNLDLIGRDKQAPTRYEPLQEFPVVEFDFSFLIDDSVRWSQIESLVSKSHELILGLKFIEEYRGKKFAEGKKSFVFRSFFGSPTGTLTKKQIDAAAKSIETGITKQFGGELRN